MDDANVLISAKKNTSVLLYKNAHTVEELYTVWDETYDKKFCGNIIFRDDSVAYQIGEKPLRKIDLDDFTKNDKIVNKFEEILRHNNVSDKENAFNRLVALFICKLVDEIQKSDEDIVDFQYKVGSDTYEDLQDRLQRLHKEGMEKFMREEIFYVADDYAEKLVQQYTGQNRKNMIDDLKNTFRILKFYTNNDFAFKDVHNEELFYQNGKILVEVVQLFEKYRIIGSNDLQMLGDLFEQLLNKGFKQNEGQFFTPIPIARFIWDSLPLDRIIKKGKSIEFPKILDYACGAGHFLTQGFEAVNAYVSCEYPTYCLNTKWAEHKIFGVEKDYRLARVSKISLFMHGAGDGNIIFGDGLECYPDKGILNNSFDILVANPPYSVRAFKPHLKLKNNTFSVLDQISNNGSEIETLFIERISQILKPSGIAAVILPVTILSKDSNSFIAAREEILKNFKIKAIVHLGRNTFGETGQPTIIMFLEKYAEPPKRFNLIHDSVDAIWDQRRLDDWEDEDIITGYLNKIGIKRSDYLSFIEGHLHYDCWADHKYFSMYYDAFLHSTEYVNKVSQKSFQKLSDEEKTSWIDSLFYRMVRSIESEKLMFYAMVYLQKVVIICPPNEKKEEAQFLGYKWVKRKGQEGIQVTTAGGVLYDVANRYTNLKLCSIVRQAFNNDQVMIDDLKKYYYYLDLQNMIDFSSVRFDKAIKTAKTKKLENPSDLLNYKLDDRTLFSISVGNRVLSSEIDVNGNIPVFSANVYEEFGRINKQNLTDFSLPSVIWGIDGDWMVNYIEKGCPFYPTDHCGVIRLSCDNIIPKYFAVVLQVEGEYEKFSRSNRASTQRIKNLMIQVPDLATQKNILEMLDEFAQSIRYHRISVSDIDQASRDILSRYIGDICKSDAIIEKILRIFH